MDGLVKVTKSWFSWEEVADGDYRATLWDSAAPGSVEVAVCVFSDDSVRIVSNPQEIAEAWALVP